jgi:RNA polymerase sigma factor (sigma-70 family)
MGRDELNSYVATNHNSLVAFVKRKLAETAHRDSEDIVQDVMVSILDGPGIAEPIVSLSAYVFRALRNRIIDEYRKPRKAVLSMDEEREGELTLAETITDGRYQPENDLRRTATATEIMEAINSLPKKQREVIIATEFNDIPIKTLAKRTKTPQGTLLARKHRGIRAIRKKYAHLREEYHGNG